MPEREAVALKGSIERFGLVQPLVWNRRTKRLVGGHQRLDALVALGEKRARVVVVDLEESDEKALNLALNRVHGDWDWSKLSTILDELAAANPELPSVAGFTDEELQRIEQDGHLLGMRVDVARAAIKTLSASIVNTAVDDPGPLEPPRKPTTRAGDLWILGDHRLLCGDSTKPDDVARVLRDERATLLATDPPYCVDYTGENRPKHAGKAGGKDWSALYREIDISDLGAFLNQFLTACLPHVAEAAPLYLWHAHIQQPVIAETFERHDLLFHQVIVWVKPSGVFGHSYFQWRHEPAAFGWRRGHKPAHGEAQLDTVWEVDWDGKARFSTFHPTSKPPRLFEIPIELHTKRDAVILEPFCGSGSQLIAAERLGRRCRAIELAPAFVDGTLLRWQEATKKLVRLDGDGRTFEEVAAARREKKSPARTNPRPAHRHRGNRTRASVRADGAAGADRAAPVT